MVIDGLEFELTCVACPEQYDVFDENHKQVGYVRLRFGNLTCDYPDYRGDEIYHHEFEEEDGFKGSFDDDNERNEFLKTIAETINAKRREQNEV
jgi:hypothetical protein